MKKKLPPFLLALFICLVHIIPFFILINLAFKSPHDTSSKWSTAAGCLISTLPAMLAYFLLQRSFVKGLTEGITK